MEKLRIGVSGLGRGAMLTLPGLAAHPSIEVAAAFDPSPAARDGFQAAHRGLAYPEFEHLCDDPAIDAIYIASPHEHHSEQAIAAAGAGKHVLVEKPMAVRIDEAEAMIAAARDSGTQLLVGPSHGYDAPVALAESIIAEGAVGRPRMIHALNYTDFLYRPRRPAELDVGQGGGVVHSQATHQIDIVRRLAGSPIRSVRARRHDWDPDRATDGAFAAMLFFENGACASLTYSGYGRYDSDALSGWVGEMGAVKDSDRTRSGPGDNELAMKAARGYGGTPPAEAAPAHHEHFGFVLASCERADLEITPDGVTVHRGDERRVHPAPLPPVLRYTVAEAFVQAVRHGQLPLFDGRWGLHTLACCHAILRSSDEDREVLVSELTEESAR